ncbi:MAG: acyltransferase [Paludibacteraceae bacterium]|nr:acyltransferase [Paludibacteraceae bacterium]
MAEKWTGKTDGTRFMQRTLVKMLRCLDVRCLYAMMVTWLPFYLLFRPSATRAQYAYFRKRQGYGVWKAMYKTWCNYYVFGQVIMDRFAAHAGRTFRFEIENRHLFYDLVNRPEGFIVLSSHLGNFEMAGYELSTPNKKMNVVLYAGDTETMMENRRRLLKAHNIELIALQKDLSHVFEINNALSNGEIVAMSADRRVGEGKTVSVKVLDGACKLPAGPFAIAASREEIVRVVFVVKERWDTYHIYIEPLEQLGSGTVREKMQHLAEQYAASLTAMAKRYPTQLFNYYDFWSDEAWI